MVVVIDDETLARIANPGPSGPCLTLFLRERQEKLGYVRDCVPTPDVYTAAQGWMEGHGRRDLGRFGLTPIRLDLRAPG